MKQVDIKVGERYGCATGTYDTPREVEVVGFVSHKRYDWSKAQTMVVCRFVGAAEDGGLGAEIRRRLVDIKCPWADQLVLNEQKAAKNRRHEVEHNAQLALVRELKQQLINVGLIDDRLVHMNGPSRSGGCTIELFGDGTVQAWINYFKEQQA